jgi:hypothetical protein
MDSFRLDVYATMRDLAPMAAMNKCSAQNNKSAIAHHRSWTPNTGTVAEPELSLIIYCKSDAHVEYLDGRGLRLLRVCYTNRTRIVTATLLGLHPGYGVERARGK